MTEVAAKPPADPSTDKVRAYSLGEEIANSVIHGLGIGLSVAALVILVAFATLSGDPYKLASAIVYGIALVLEYTASTLYHSFPQPKVKHLFKIFDHCGIYLLIAGTYTPFCLVTLREVPIPWLADGISVGWLMFGVIWGLAVAGIAAEAFWPYRPRWLSARAAHSQARPCGRLATRRRRSRLHGGDSLLRHEEDQVHARRVARVRARGQRMSLLGSPHLRHHQGVGELESDSSAGLSFAPGSVASFS